LVVNLVLSRVILDRLEGLASALSRFGGEKRQPLIQDSQPDEIGQLADAFNTMAKKIISRNEENRALSDHLQRQNAHRGLLLKRLITAQEDERKRVARELHDDLGQVFGGLALRLEAMERFVVSDAGTTLQQLRETKKLVADGTERMYDLILDLRPSALDDLGLVTAFRSLTDRSLVNTGIKLTFDVDGMNGRLPPEIETNLYRIFQEALSNVVRHSEATELFITLACNENAFSGAIVDNGRGFDLTTAQSKGNDSRGLGLLGMEERVSQCGGQIEITSELSHGTKIAIFIPLIPDVYGQSNSSFDS
jgi:signal transduction histidine kinase